MRRTLLTALVAALLATVAVPFAAAQTAGPTQGSVTAAPQAKKGHGDGPILKQLGLSKQQAGQIKALKKQIKEDWAKYRTEHAGDKKALKEGRAKSREAYVTGLKGILTKDQFAKYQELAKEAKEKAKANKIQKQP